MNISFYTGASGMIAQQTGLNIYSNNIANVNTVGFKAERPSFADCLYVEYRATEPEWETGHGQYVMKTDFMWEEGTLRASDQPMDFGIAGEGFFMVTNRYGDTFLTRDGSFEMTMNADNNNTWELVNGVGEYVLDNEGNHIQIPFETETNADGEVITTQIVDYAALEEMLGIFNVPNNWGLEQADNNHFVVTARSGEAVPYADAVVMREYLEMSTTDIATDMVHIIESQRSYQLSAKVVQTSDEFIRIANNLRS